MSPEVNLWIMGHLGVLSVFAAACLLGELPNHSIRNKSRFLSDYCDTTKHFKVQPRISMPVFLSISISEFENRLPYSHIHIRRCTYNFKSKSLGSFKLTSSGPRNRSFDVKA